MTQIKNLVSLVVQIYKEVAFYGMEIKNLFY